MAGPRGSRARWERPPPWPGSAPPGPRRYRPSPKSTCRPDVPEPTVGESERPNAAPAEERTATPGASDAAMPGDGGRRVGKPEHAGKAPGLGNPRARIGPRDVGKPAERGDGGPGAGRTKVVLCHKGKTLTLGAPAQAAHLRHGDSLGA